MSSPPVKYLRYFDFTNFATLNPEKPLPGASVDVELNRLKVTTDQTIDRLGLIQNDDGTLKGVIGTAQLADGAVTEPKLATGAVSARALGDGQVTTAKLGFASVDNTKLAIDAVTTSILKDQNVTTPKIADGAVTGPKIAPGSLQGSNLAPGSIGSTQLQDGGVQTVDLADLSVTQGKLALLSVGTPQLIDAAVTSAKLAASLALAGIPTAPTPATGTNTTQLATTAFVAASMSAAGAITEAPNDGALYGRQALGWQLGVKLAGDVMTGPLQLPFLRLGGATNLFAGLKSIAAVLKARLADDSGDAAFSSADHTPGANIISSLGSAALRWLKLWAKDGDFSGDLAVGGNANITGILTAGSIAPATLAAVPNKNYFTNGDFKIDQRNGYTQFLPANASFLADRFQYFCTQAGKFNFQARNVAATAAPLGSPVSTWASFDSAGVYVSSGNDQFDFAQYFEGYDLIDFLWGTPQAKNAVLSFYAYASVAGDYSVVIRNVPGTHSFLVKYNIPTAGLFYKIVVPIPGPTVGTWGTGSAASLVIDWTLDGAGTSLTVPTGAWAAAVLKGATGQTKMLSTAGSAFAIAAIKLELGNVATPFVPLPMDEALARCQRYYWNDTVAVNYPAWIDGGSADYFAAFVNFPVAMRIAPSGSFINIGQFAYSDSTNSNHTFTPVPGVIAVLVNTRGGHLRINAGTPGQGGTNIYKLGYWAIQCQFSADP
jgi:hypothetical protein